MSSTIEPSNRQTVLAHRLIHTIRDMEIALDLGDIDMARTHLETLRSRAGDLIGASL